MELNTELKQKAIEMKNFNMREAFEKDKRSTGRLDRAAARIRTGILIIIKLFPNLFIDGSSPGSAMGKYTYIKIVVDY